MDTKIKCLLLDDELPGLAYLRMMCEQIPEVEVVKAFNDPLKLLGEAPGLEFDFCILDIEMPGLNGLQVAGLLKSKPVIFTTAYREYAPEAFDLDAVDYLCKPIKKERLEKAVYRVIRSIKVHKAGDRFIQLNTNKGRALIFFDQLVLITTDEVDKRDKLAFLEEGNRYILKNITFEKLMSILPEENFCRVNKKEIIALKAVRFFTSGQITSNLMDDAGKERVLKLSGKYRGEFLKKSTR